MTLLVAWATPGSAKQGPDSPLQISIGTTTIRGASSLLVTLTNRTPDEQHAWIHLEVPPALTCAEPQATARLPGNGTRHVFFTIRNDSGAAGQRHHLKARLTYRTGQSFASITQPFVVTTESSFGAWPLALLALLALLLVCQTHHLSAFLHRVEACRFRFLVTPAMLLIILAFLAYHLACTQWFMDTLTVGGDTPAHNYLASHTGHKLLTEGRIVSWSDGWWCGFPMFQYYFPLPYILVAVADIVLPFNVAFKLISVLGIMSLPLAAYASGRILRMQRPLPLLLAIATIPFLFDHTHTMWGANIYSTLAGMIANSISFPLMLLAVSCGCRDADDGQFRLRTVACLVLLTMCHFFTPVMAALTLLAAPFLFHRHGFGRAVSVLFREALLAFLLVSWWIIPLIHKHAYAVDFGGNWSITLAGSLPDVALWAMALIPPALILGLRRRQRSVSILGWMLLIATLLFTYGHGAVGLVFQNIRLWPFIMYALLALAAIGYGLIIQHARLHALGVLIALLASLTIGIDPPNHTRSWAHYNYSGLEAKPGWPIFREFMTHLKDTPGRLAVDLSDEREPTFGSDRIFESVPHVIGKPVLEGGIVNSALGSLLAYRLQGEYSHSTAGAPGIVDPAHFDMELASHHLELAGVKHLIARWAPTQQALSQSDDWTLLKEMEGWQLYQLETHAGHMVEVPAFMPFAVRAHSLPPQQGDLTTEAGYTWKTMGLQWLATKQALNHPCVILRNDHEPTAPFPTILSADDYTQHLETLSRGHPTSLQPASTHFGPRGVLYEEVEQDRIRFVTDAVGLPHIIKVTYFPNWKVRGADHIYMVTPHFMLVYPTQREVELYYGSTVADNVGRGLTLLGALFTGLMLFYIRVGKVE